MKNNIFKRVLSAVLCLFMLTSALLVLTSCDEEPEVTEEALVSVVKIVKDIPAGTVITGGMITTEEVRVSDAHINAIRVISKVKGKVALQDMYAGELVFASKLGEPTEEEEEKLQTNLVVTEHITLDEDISDALQQLIDENPGKTIEFPDGDYIIAKPITVSADPAKAVSLRLADYAVIRASDDWDSEEAMVQLSVGEISEESTVNSFYLDGGTIDGNHVAKALYVENGRDLLVANVSLINTALGLEVAEGRVDVENLIIVGTDADDSHGMIIGGKDCSIVNVRISNVLNGVDVTGANNLIKSVQAVCVDNSQGTYGFYDDGYGTMYDMCFSEQFSVGFKMSAESIAVYSACSVKWTSAANKKHTAFESVKKFNSLIRGCTVDFSFAESNSSFLKAGASGGSGQIIYPIIGGKKNMDNQDFRDYLVSYRDEEDPVIYR